MLTFWQSASLNSLLYGQKVDEEGSYEFGKGKSKAADLTQYKNKA
jgi:hypothetical protein